ncbi:MAG: hypothetical protein NZ455_15585 [Bacteroidia bacterium]|nr:hypothetical protein [Bacteroidia bacterium]MDW8347978.1 hypothetical protein [Bacteroidia bacterium]
MLSAYEVCILHDKAFFEAKHAIMQKWERFLSHTADEIYPFLSRSTCILPDEVKMSTPKISKGENYQGMPYMVLDYPRYFGKEDICVFRNILLWNRGLYSTWVFQGKYLPLAVQSFSLPSEVEIYLHQNTDKWVHEISPGDILLEPSTYSNFILETLNKLDYLKFSAFLSFEQWNVGLSDRVYKVFSCLG